MGTGLDELGERQHSRHGLALGAFEGALGHVDGLGGEAPHEGLHGHRGQHIAAELYVAAGAGQAEGLDEVTLGGVVLADIERGPPGEPRQLGGHGKQFAADVVGEGALQERGSAAFEAVGDGVRLPVPPAVLGVPAAGIVGGVPQFVQVGPADLARALMVGPFVGGADQPTGDGDGERGHGKAGAGLIEQVAAVHGAPERSGDADGVGGISREIQPHIRLDCLRLAHTDFGETDGPPEPFGDRLRQQLRHRPLGHHAAHAPVHDRGMRVVRRGPCLVGELVDAVGQRLVARTTGFDEPGQVRVGRTAPADGRCHGGPLAGD
ncbi:MULTISPECIES: hypothetical protein [unclassified Streptomyces]|uniref:hypothetical protein n=1 Tax=unclassified Streptomyces TaxID=2593676 RepID=UPI0033F6A3EF